MKIQVICTKMDTRIFRIDQKMTEKPMSIIKWLFFKASLTHYTIYNIIFNFKLKTFNCILLYK